MPRCSGGSYRLKLLLVTFQQSASHSAFDGWMIHSGVFGPNGRLAAQTAGTKAFSSATLQSLRTTLASESSPQPTATRCVSALRASRHQQYASSVTPRKPWNPLAAKASAKRQQQRQQQKTAVESDQLLKSAASDRVSQASAEPEAAPSTSSYNATAWVSGTIQRITYRSDVTGYTVAKMQVDRSGDKLNGSEAGSKIVTVTGALPDMSVGQQWKCDGHWMKHSSFGLQLDTHTATEMQPTDAESLVSYLCGGATKGVGPVTARNMVDTYGDTILNVLDSSDAERQLLKVRGIGAATAAKIKDSWEQRRGNPLQAKQYCNAPWLAKAPPNLLH